ncbi:MAG: hypothetical protein WA761_07565 [Thermoplasmata archaeon]
MSIDFCGSCRTRLPSGADRCPLCGTSTRSGPTPPTLETDPSAGNGRSHAGPWARVTQGLYRWRRGPSFLKVVAILLVVVVVAGGTGLYLWSRTSTGSGQGVDITSVVFLTNDCQANLSVETTFSGPIPPGHPFSMPFVLRDNASPLTSCSVTSVTTGTPGFAAPGSIDPLVVCGGNRSVGEALDLRAPAGRFVGELVLRLGVNASAQCPSNGATSSGPPIFSTGLGTLVDRGGAQADLTRPAGILYVGAARRGDTR